MIETKHELIIIIPTYNEEGTISNVINKWEKECKILSINFHIHVYDDNSTDKSPNILKQIKSENITVHNLKRIGYGPTLIKGYIENCGSEWLFQIDSDDEMGTELFKEFWQKRENYDFLIGRRKLHGKSVSRRIISFFSRLVVFIFYGRKVYDVNSPYRLMRCDKFKDLYVKLPPKMDSPNIAISGYASIKNLRVYEATIAHYQRKIDNNLKREFKFVKNAIRSFFEIVACRFKIK